MDRRQFISWIGVGAIASYLPVALAACNSESEETEAEGAASPAEGETTEDSGSINAEGFLTLGSVKELEEKGSLGNKKFDVLVINKPDEESLVAVNPLCPHQGCSVEWKSEESNFVCPCHGSKFAADGTVTNGPATKALATYEVKEEEEKVLVKVG